tara:strand:+ start:105 stop:563 length:459 start_codon:yes stop_codon:yes gene_type:complete
MVNVPSNWPENIEYSNVQSFFGLKNIKKDCITGVKIKKINDINSVVNGQFGLFASQDFEKYDVLGQYTGDVVSLSSGGTYVASCDKCCVDSEFMGNELRFVNDHRNISDEPNTTIRISYIDKKPRVLFVVTKDIKEGEQILTKYGDNYWKFN